MKKHIKKIIKNVYKSINKKTITFFLILIFISIILFQKDTQQTELQFVRNIQEEFVHNAPNNQRDYLFQDEGGQEIYQGTIGNSNENIQNNNGLINETEILGIINELTKQTTGALYTGTLTTGNTSLKKPFTETTGSLDCITPWGEIVKHKDFVLAYEQRKDVNIMCNIEKRVCMSGILFGSFPQRSCRDDIVYEYKKAEIISYNQKILNEYIQPTPPKNIGATFDTKGKINTKEQPIDTRGTNNSPIIIQPEVQQETINKKNCTTPRGQKINHGQFIKAYKTPRGFIDMPCEVELRTCINGILKGNFRYSSCTFYNTTYDDYLSKGSPSSNTGFLFFERIKKLIRR